LKSNLLLKLFILLFSTSLLFSNNLQEIKNQNELRHLGIPYANFVTGLGDGLDVELIRGFAKYLNVEYKYIKTTWKDSFKDLRGQNKEEIVEIKGDILASGITILEKRKELVNFSEPVFPTAVWLVARSDSTLVPIKPTGNIDQDIKLVKNLLDNKSVLAYKNTCLDPRLHNMYKTNANIILYSNIINLNELVPAILNNNAEATLLDVPDTLVALEKWPGEIKVIGPISKNQNMGVAFRKDSPELLKEFNKYLKIIKKNGSYYKIVRKYYPDIFYYYKNFFKK
jgi:ABC-type amino acid transport substrate-binding protein